MSKRAAAENASAPPSKKDNAAEFFAGIGQIEYKGWNSLDPLSFKHYDASRVVLGKTMKEWLRFSVCYWHTFRGNGSDPFGAGTIDRPWDDGSNTVENAKRRLRAAFEFMSKLGVEYWTFHDRDIAPEGKTLEETNDNLDQVVDLAEELMQETGIKLLWGTANLFSHPRYMNGAATSPDAHTVAYAAAQVKKAMEVTKRLGGENFVFWGGREGYQSVLNTNVKRELDHYAAFLTMAKEYKKKIGFQGTLLIEPKPREPTKHQYDYDAQTVIGFLHTYGLHADFKLNIEPNHTTLAGHSYEHDILLASVHGMLGSVDANTGDPLLGWDTDMFPSSVRDTTLAMKVVVDQGGLGSGGLNFDCKVRRESTALQDMFIAHIGAMDAFARGLLNVARIKADALLDAWVAERYQSFDSGIGKEIASGAADFESLARYIKELGEPQAQSGQQEKFEMLFNRYV